MVAIFVAFMFLCVVLTDLGVEKWKARRAAQAAHTARAAAFVPETLWQVPEDVHLSNSHTWFRPDPAGGMVAGADTLITYAMGAVSKVVLPKPGDQVTAGQSLFRLVRDGHSITVPSTLTGRIVAVNNLLVDQPSLVNSDPYGSGWICQMTPTSIGAVSPSMRFGEKAILWLEGEFSRLGGFLSAQYPKQLQVGATSQDGGYPSAGCLNELDSTAWSAFETEFLNRN